MFFSKVLSPLSRLKYFIFFNFLWSKKRRNLSAI